jgi:hypothetical protein
MEIATQIELSGRVRAQFKFPSLYSFSYFRYQEWVAFENIYRRDRSVFGNRSFQNYGAADTG